MEKTKKKILALILGLTASMTLGACGEGISSGSNNSGTDPISNSPVSSGGDSASDSPVSSGTDSTIPPISSGTDSGSDSPISSGTDSGSDSPISSGTDSTTDPISSGTDSGSDSPISSGTDSTGTTVSPSTDSPSTSTSSPLPSNIKVNGVNPKKSFVTYATNKGEQDNKKTEYFDRTQTYKVGTMNNFNVMPIVTFLDKNNGTEVTVDSWLYDIKIEVKEDQTYQEIVNSNSQYIDSVDIINCNIDFADDAQGHTFKITVSPQGLLPHQIGNTAYQVSMEVDVEDGYNVYNALDLSYLYKSDGAYSTAWSRFKQEKNIDQTISPTTFFFQDNIVVTKDSIPSAYFYNEGDSDLSESDSDYDRALGSLRDYANIYLYDFQDDTSSESIKIAGNYFNLDSSKLPVVVRDRGEVTTEGTVISHSTLIYGACEKDYMESKYFEMRDINFLGNSPRTEDVTKSGGLILSKMQTEAKWINCIATSFFITFYDEKSVAPLLIEQCKAYDNFNSFIYSWGGVDLTINKCEMIGAGGPIIIQDHIFKDTEDEQIPNTKVTDSKLENYVAGTEGWFSVVKADGLTGGIKALNGAFTPYGKSFLKTKEGTSGETAVTMFNLICINKDGGAEGPTASVVKGRLTIDSNPYFDYGTYDNNSSPYLKGFIEAVSNQQTAEVTIPMFQSCGTNGYAYFGGDTVGLLGADNQPVTSTHPIFTGDYLTLYYQGMMLNFGYTSVS